MAGVHFVYLCWACLPAQHRSGSAARMAGLLLVPLFNLSWAFVAVYGLSRRTLAASGQADGRGLMGLALAACVLWVGNVELGLVPVLNLALLTAFPVVWGLWLMGQARATRRLLGQEDADPAAPLWVLGLFSAQGACLLLCMLGMLLLVPEAGTGTATDSPGGVVPFETLTGRYARDVADANHVYRGKPVAIQRRPFLVDPQKREVLFFDHQNKFTLTCTLRPGVSLKGVEPGRLMTLWGVCAGGAGRTCRAGRSSAGSRSPTARSRWTPTPRSCPSPGRPNRSSSHEGPFPTEVVKWPPARKTPSPRGSPAWRC